MIHMDAGYYTQTLPPAGTAGPVYQHLWYLKDHLGNHRVLADASGNAVAIHDYDPYREEIAVATGDLFPLPPGGTDSPYKYGGKEWNATTSTYDFEARYLSPSFHRFTTMDPLCEQYYSISPYAYCANNPVNLIDFTGEGPLRPAPKELLGTAAYYQWRNTDYQSRHPGKTHSYYLSYGYPNALRFESIPKAFLSDAGNIWKEQVELLLQEELENILTGKNPIPDVDPELFEDNPDEFLDYAFNSHVSSYLTQVSALSVYSSCCSVT